MARSTDRLAATGRRLDELGFRWQRIDAVDGRALGEVPWRHFDEFAYRYFWGKRPHANELGCYLAIKEFLTGDNDTAVILEADALLPDDLPDILRELVDNSDAWDVVKLDSRHRGMPVTTCRLRNGRRLVAFTQRSTGAAGYMLNRRAAQSYVQKLLPMKVPYDLAFDQVWRFGPRMRDVLPRPVKAGGFPSDIGYDGKEGSSMFLYRRLASPLYERLIGDAMIGEATLVARSAWPSGWRAS